VLSRPVQDDIVTSHASTPDPPREITCAREIIEWRNSGCVRGRRVRAFVYYVQTTLDNNVSACMCVVSDRASMFEWNALPSTAITNNARATHTRTYIIRIATQKRRFRCHRINFTTIIIIIIMLARLAYELRALGTLLRGFFFKDFFFSIGGIYRTDVYDENNIVFCVNRYMVCVPFKKKKICQSSH
jgi:hypothetical protein